MKLPLDRTTASRLALIALALAGAIRRDRMRRATTEAAAAASST